MPLKLAPSRPHQSASAFGTVILLASGLALGSSAALAQRITDSERNADALMPVIPASMQADTARANEESAEEERAPAMTDEVPASAATSTPTDAADTEADTAPAAPAPQPAPEEIAAPSPAAEAEPEAVDATEADAQQAEADGVDDGPAAEIVEPSASDEEIESVETRKPTLESPELEADSEIAPTGKLDLRADKAMAPLQPVLPALTRRPVADAGSLPPLAAPEELPSAEPESEGERATAPEADTTPVASGEQVPESPTATAAPAPAPATPAPTQIPTPVPTPLPTAVPTAVPTVLPTTVVTPTAEPTVAPTAIPVAPSVAQELRVYYASGNAQLSAREKEAVEALYRKAKTLANALIEVHLSLPSAEAVRLVALRQAELRAIARKRGITGESLRFRLAPYAADSAGSLGAPLAPHYAEFRLIENDQ